ncbi:unnamed protein product [Psylliodes chrysocephalus]|uniref:CCHC-type domain-containing protein n=1 Tax=Psylliodes chrysocephalus TaxID=3402493 RepID=A0A9P0GDB2_9CUCU|nr:unnamed protein product [Psylliodes chrysocephala]
MNHPTNQSYSTVLTQQKYPSKNQAIIFTPIDGAKLQDYLLPLGEIVHPKNIIFCSKLSNNRICMYLSSQEIVEKFMNDYSGIIEINNEILQARRYVTPSERIILSNVCPSIPHDILIKELEHIGVTILSPITFLKNSASLPEFNHILSFRRQVFIKPTALPIPESFLINYENTSYRIFLVRDILKCFNCKQEGHTSTNCKTAPTSTNPSEIPSIPNQSQNSIIAIPETITPSSAVTASTSVVVVVVVVPNPLKNMLLKSNATSIENANNPQQQQPKQAIESNASAMEIDQTPSSTKRNIDDTLSPPILDETSPNFTKPLDPTPKKKKSKSANLPEKTLEDFIKEKKRIHHSYSITTN